MCSRFQTPHYASIASHFNTTLPSEEYKAEVFPRQRAPIVVATGEGGRETWLASFGLVAPWSKDGKPVGSTFNARSETAARLSTFRHAWKERQTCLVPVIAFSEPCYETGKNVWHDIRRKDGEPFAIAGFWEIWRRDGLPAVQSFTMLTVDGSTHPIMKRMHGPDDEKRSVVVLSPDSYDDWLMAANDDEIREQLQLFDPDPFEAVPHD